MRSAVIVDIVRTGSGRGKLGGALSGVHPATLLSVVLQALVNRTGIDPAIVDDVIAGCVSQVGEQAGNIGRTALLTAGFPESVPATTVDRQCGSSQQALHFAAQGVLAGGYDIAIACGVESMSRLPMGTSLQGGDPFAPLAQRYPAGLIGQGLSAELIAARWKLDRGDLDQFSARSHELAARTTRDGGFAEEIVAVPVTDAAGDVTEHAFDETIRQTTTPKGLAGLKPSFYDPRLGERFPEIEWVITAGNSSPLTDGAAAALIVEEQTAQRLGLTPRARFHTFAVAGSDPILMLTGVIPATKKIIEKSGLSLEDIDAFEVNEAFAAVPLAWVREFGVDLDRVNPRGGAIAIGHALGGSGVRLMATLVNHLEATGARFGLQTMCEGGGMANATIVERL